MPSVFISYSHDQDDPKHAERVAGVAASLLSDGLEVFFDQNRGDEERVPWPIWMEDKIDVADHVLLVCTELYLKKVRQQVATNEGRGVCWEANLIYNWLYERKLNTSKFIPVLLSPEDEPFIPGPLKGTDRFVLDSKAGYDRLYAFLTGQHRTLFPERGATLQLMPPKGIRPLFGPAGKGGAGAASKARTEPRKGALAINPRLILRPDLPPAPRQDVRGLDWYDECDAAHFLGREDDANRLLAMLLSHPVIRLVGPSGVGKSSLLRAGLLPKIREFGWRACVIRPFEKPAQQVIPQLTAGLLANGGKFTAPLNPARFRAEVTPLLSAAGITRLVLLIDQFEDVISPVADSTAVDSMRDFLREIWEQREAKPCLRAVIVYRTDADARLGRLWQEVSGRPEGLPYLALKGLSHDVAERIIGQTAREQGWTLEMSVSGIVRQLAQESQALGCSGEVFPVYLQIFLKHAQQSADGRVTADSIAGMGGVSGLIGKYLEQTLARLKARGGDWQHCGAILEVLSRSAGRKAAQSLDDLARETGLSRSMLVQMLPVLVKERLVRPVGRESYEIQHDRLAAAVVENMKDSDRDAKAARDFLAAKVPVFDRAKIAVSHEDLVHLYRHRRRIHPTEHELQIILASLVDERSAPDSERDSSPGWYWFAGSSLQQWSHRLVQVLRWASDDQSALRSFYLWTGRIPFAFLAGHADSRILAPLRELVGAPDWQLRGAAAEALTYFGQAEDLPLINRAVRDQPEELRESLLDALSDSRNVHILPLLRNLIRDQDQEVQLAALRGLVNFGRWKDILPIFEFTARNTPEVRRGVVQAIASAENPRFAPILRPMVKDMSQEVRIKAIEALGKYGLTADLPLIGELALHGNFQIRCKATEIVSEMGGGKALPLLRELAQAKSRKVRLRALVGLGRFGQAKDLRLIRRLVFDNHARVQHESVEVLASSGSSIVLPLLRELAATKKSAIRLAALAGLARFGQSRDLHLIRELVAEKDPSTRFTAIQMLEVFGGSTVIPLLIALTKDNDKDVRMEAVEVLTRSDVSKAFPILRELSKNADIHVRWDVVRVLAGSHSAKTVPLLRELTNDNDLTVRHEAIKALMGLAQAEDIPFLRNAVLDPEGYLATDAVRALVRVSSRAELESFLNQHEQQLPAEALVALDERLYMPEWLKEVAQGD